MIFTVSKAVLTALHSALSAPNMVPQTVSVQARALLKPSRDARLDARPQIGFNYLGHFDPVVGAGGAAVRVLPIGGAGGVNPLAARTCDLDVSALVLGAEGVVEFQFTPSRLPAADVARLREAFDEELGAIVDHCAGVRAPELTPADLTYSALSLDELDELFE